MGNLTSTLTLKLVDGVTGPAQKASRSLKQVDAAAKGVKGGGPLGALAARGSGMTLAWGRGLAAVGGTAALAVGAREAYVDFAALERKMTYVGLTAGASADATRRATLELRKMAQAPGSPGLDKTVEGLEALVAAGRTLPEAMEFLPSVTRTAVAANADITDMATTADALGAHFKIAAKEMQRGFDILVEGGKLGKFELKDMARYLPSLAPAAAAVGFKGAEGLKRFVAVLQTIRQGTGTPEEAAASAMNVFSKMESDETAKRFLKFGVNLRKEMAKARKEGKDLFETFIQLSARALKGDMSKLPQLFQDQEFARGMRALLSMPEALRKFNAALANVDGSTMADFGRIVGDAQDKLDQLNASMRELKHVSGTALAPMATEFVDQMTLQIREISGRMKDLDGWFQRNAGGNVDAFLRRLHLAPESTADYRARIEQQEAERENPALKDVREARDMAAKFAAAAAALEKAAEKIDPKRATTGELVTLRNLETARAEMEAAFKRLSEARQRAAQAQFGEPGPMTQEDLSSIPRTMGTMKQAMDMKPDASAAGAAAMQAFATAMQSQTGLAMAVIDRFVAEAKARLSFTAAPRIDLQVPPMPVPVPPPGGSGKQSRMLNGSAARRMVREESDTMFRHSGLG